MKGKMDGAARRADGVARRVLPERPHHLCIDPKRRYPNPSGYWFSGPSAGLQYMTYLSDADRGVLLTRPFFEIHDEPDVPKPLKAAARGEAKKKMSFKDYQNRKKSTSPADNDPLAKLDSQRAGSAAPREGKRTQEPKPNHRDVREHVRPEKPQQEGHHEKSENSSLPRPESNSTRAPESRKRLSEIETTSPPPKKIKTEAGAPELDSSRVPKLDNARSRDTANGKSAHKDAMAANPHTAVNGRAHLGANKGRASPAANTHVNGVLRRSRNTSSPPPKADASVKPAVPDLLSPLRLGFDEEIDAPKKTAGKPSEKGQKDSGRSRSDSRTGVPDLLSPLRLGLDGSQSKSGKKPAEKGGGTRAREADAHPPPKKPKPPMEIPALLSPTLPPLIEEELALLKNSPSDWSLEDGRDSESPPVSSGKARAQGPDNQAKPLSRIVTLKYKKKTARTVAAILALPSKSHKEALKKDRSLSLERTPPPHARKRPLLADEQIFESTSKRSRPTAEPPSAKPVVPSTPRKNTATAMSRVTSSNSQAHTPGDSTGFTPSVADRPRTSSDSVDHASGAKAATLRQRQAEYMNLGGKLKHSKDGIIRSHGQAGLSTADEKRVAALHFEMILAYMVAFNALNQARALDRKVADLKTWETLLPHFPELKHRIRRCRPLLGLAVQMHAICLEQITQAFMTLDPTSVTVAHPSWAKMEKRRVPTWTEAMSLLAEVPDGDGMKASIGPWTPVDDAVASALAIMRQWADRESVKWRPEVVVPMASHP